ncbi:gamma-glutamyltransferase family protein [Acuticoccus kandeliae]|uniref:gamma-glutamyltransferase family protein n=1 Tax=Acuticoccus kandeliae TaxID=2073160 RepID=UPI000D3E6F18|nr:gamma-glutamyltransferase [Acuticoccus kandeliae]
MSAPYRARLFGTRHMASAGHYLAAQAALQILENGGNAIDAGVAGGIALGVLQSDYVSFGGVAPIMIQLAETGEVITISGLGPWPRAASVDYFRDNHDGLMPKGIMRTVVPAAPDAWITALTRYGTISFAEAAGAALRFARDGFPIAPLTATVIEKYREDYAAYPSSAAIYLPDGAPPKAGDLFVQSDLGRTIQYMIDEETSAAGGGREAGLEAARAAFYRGDIAREMVRYHAENGGWLAAEDLATFRSDVDPALRFTFGDTEVFTCGPWCQGPLLGQTLQMLDGFDFRSAGYNTSAYIHHVVEAAKLAYSDRHHFYGDPKFVDVPIEILASQEYAAERRKAINPHEAYRGMPAPGKIGRPGADAAPRPFVDDGAQLDTSYICVVDSAGNAFSATPSDSSVGAPVIPGLGFVPSTRGSQSWTDPRVPAVLAPGKRPRLTPNPAFARRGREWMMPFGSPGNDMQPQAMIQVFLNIVVWGMNPQNAVEAPRFGSVSYPRSSEPHAFDPGLLQLEGRISDSTADALADLGHDVKRWPDWEWVSGAVCAIVAEPGRMEGAADPRRPSGVAGW